VTWDQVGGLETVKRELREAVEWPLRHADLLSRAGVSPAKGILLHGPPGTGKTLLAKAVASQSGVNFISVKGPSLLSKFVGESERAIREVFKKARQAAPCIVFFDEIDALAPTRSSGAADSNVSQRVISQLLTEMDGVEELKGVLVVAATNRRDMLDPALLRPGRFDLLLEVPPPDAPGRAQILAVHLAGRPVATDVAPEELVRRTEGFTGAEIEAACERAALLAVRSFLDRGAGDPAGLQVTARDLERSVDEVRDGRTGGPAAGGRAA
jgi:transitional endoplasmic reticulum ATPase